MHTKCLLIICWACCFAICYRTTNDASAIPYLAKGTMTCIYESGFQRVEN